MLDSVTVPLSSAAGTPIGPVATSMSGAIGRTASRFNAAGEPPAPPTPQEFFTSVATLAGGKILSVPGGVFVRDGAGTLLGAVGVTGDASLNDEAAAVAGIEAAGLVPVTGRRELSLGRRANAASTASNALRAAISTGSHTGANGGA